MGRIALAVTALIIGSATAVLAPESPPAATAVPARSPVMAAAPPRSPAAVTSVSVDSNGNLVLNDQPFLLIQGTNMDYANWIAAGYTGAQADAKLAQLVQWGYNTLFGNWNQFSPGTIPGQMTWMYQDQLAWQRHGLYWHGGATLDDTFTSSGNIVPYGTPRGQAVMGQIVARYKTHPGLLLWWIANEIDYSAQTPINYCAGAKVLASDDPTRITGETMVDTDVRAYESILGARCLPLVLVEEVMQYRSSAIAIAHAYDGLRRLNQAWTDGFRFVLGFSATPIAEIDSWPNGFRQMTPLEIHRYFMFQVAMNVRAFDVLWGANQRARGVPRGDTLPPAYLDAWNSIGQEIARVKSLQSIILAPGRWEQTVTGPAFQAYTNATRTPKNDNDFVGIYAAKKTVGPTTYLIACNMDWTSSDTSPWIEHGISGATIDVGFAIKSATRMFESEPVAFSGRVIRDSFAPAGVHVYAITQASH